MVGNRNNTFGSFKHSGKRRSKRYKYLHCELCGKKLADNTMGLACDKCLYYASYIINYCVDVRTGMCELVTSEVDEKTGKCKTYSFPIMRRYDREALTQLLYAASNQYNADYVSEDHVFNLVTNAIDSIFLGIQEHGIKKRRSKEEILAA